MPTHEHHLPYKSLSFNQQCHLFDMRPHPSNPQDIHPPLLVNSRTLLGITSKDLPSNPHFLIMGMNPKLFFPLTPLLPSPLIRKVAEIMEESSQSKANPLHFKVLVKNLNSSVIIIFWSLVSLWLKHWRVIWTIGSLIFFASSLYFE